MLGKPFTPYLLLKQRLSLKEKPPPFVFFFFLGPIWNFPGQGSNWSCSCGPTHSHSNTGSLTHCQGSNSHPHVCELLSLNENSQHFSFFSLLSINAFRAETAALRGKNLMAHHTTPNSVVDGENSIIQCTKSDMYKISTKYSSLCKNYTIHSVQMRAELKQVTGLFLCFP